MTIQSFSSLSNDADQNTEDTGSKTENKRAQRNATQEFRTFPGYTSQERHMLRQAFQVIIDDKKHHMRTFIMPSKEETHLKKTQSNRIPMNELTQMLPQMMKKKFACLTETIPPKIRHVQAFLDEFHKPNAIIHIQESDNDNDDATPGEKQPKSPNLCEESQSSPTAEERN
jgi:hypothetical protein